MKLDDCTKQYLVKEIQSFYGENESKLKSIFTLNQQIFGVNFYGNISGDDFNTRITNLVIELIKTNSIKKFIEIVRRQDNYQEFAIQCNLEQQELIEILNEGFENNKEILTEAYKLYRYERKIGEIQIPNNANELIAGLTITKKEGQNYSYIERFVVYLLEIKLKLSTSLMKEGLRLWAEKCIDNYDRLVSQLRREEEERKEMKPVLLIAVNTSGEGYTVEAWLIKNLDEYDRQNSMEGCKLLSIQNPQTDKNLVGVDGTVRYLIDECIDITNNIPEQIHLFLPHELMNHPVECWKTYEGENESETIGYKYEVIIRCSEALRGKNPRIIQWQKQGKLLIEKMQEQAQNVFVLGYADSEISLEKKLRQQKAIAVKIVPVFQQKQPGELLWKSAVPLALWIRQQLPDINNKEVLDQLLQHCPLQELPDRVKNRRLDAMDCQPPDTHVGRHLCLLWDDPNFLPPQQLLTEKRL